MKNFNVFTRVLAVLAVLAGAQPMPIFRRHLGLITK